MHTFQINAIERTFKDIQTSLEMIKPEGVRDALIDIRMNQSKGIAPILQYSDLTNRIEKLEAIK